MQVVATAKWKLKREFDVRDDDDDNNDATNDMGNEEIKGNSN